MKCFSIDIINIKCATLHFVVFYLLPQLYHIYKYMMNISDVLLKLFINTVFAAIFFVMLVDFFTICYFGVSNNN